MLISLFPRYLRQDFVRTFEETSFHGLCHSFGTRFGRRGRREEATYVLLLAKEVCLLCCIDFILDRFLFSFAAQQIFFCKRNRYFFNVCGLFILVSTRLAEKYSRAILILFWIAPVSRTSEVVFQSKSLGEIFPQGQVSFKY